MSTLASNASAALSNTRPNLVPPQFTALFDFIASDDRPTFIISPSPSPQILLRNTAFKNLLTTRQSRQKSLNAWINAVSTINPGTSLVSAGHYGGQSWTCNRISDSDYIVVRCKWGNNKAEVPLADDEQLVVQSTLNKVDARKTYDECRPTKWLVDWTRFPSAAVYPWAQYLRGLDWGKTRLGPMESWPDELCQLVVTHMSCSDPRAIFWGDDALVIVNEATVAITKDLTQGSMGQPLIESWGQQTYDGNLFLLQQALQNGKPARAEKLEFIVDRSGFVEETYFDINLLPSCGKDGFCNAMISEFVEVTSAVMQAHRNKLMSDVLEQVTFSTNLVELWTKIVEAFAKSVEYLPYTLIYTKAHNEATQNITKDSHLYYLQGSSGIVSNQFPKCVDVRPNSGASSLARAFENTGASETIKILNVDNGTMPDELHIEDTPRGAITSACIIPITSSHGGEIISFIVMGLNPRRPFETDDIHLAGAIRNLIVRSADIVQLPNDQRQAEELKTLNNSLLQELRQLVGERYEATFARMARHAPIGMYMVDAAGAPRYVNDKWLELTGFSSLQQILEINKTKHFWREITEQVNDVKIANSVVPGPSLYGIAEKSEHRLLMPRDEFTPSDAPRRFNRWVEAIKIPEYDNDQNVIGMMGFIVDVSDRKRAEDLQAQQLKDALETKKAADSFIDMVSHEMRNPLSAILQLADGISTLVSSRPRNFLLAEVGESLLDTARTIVFCAQHQKTIIDDILNLSKLDSNLVVLVPESVRPLELVYQARKIHDAEYAAANIQVDIDIRENYRLLAIDWVFMDASRWLQVVINLLSNAVKFTKDSGRRRITLRLTASTNRPTWEHDNITFASTTQSEDADRETSHQKMDLEMDDAEDLFLQFAVIDTGRGLTKDELDRLFHRFSQGSAKTHKKYGGSGLGLYISKQLTELHGGQIGVKSEGLGEGSTFAFYIKVQRSQAPLKKEDLHTSSRSDSKPIKSPTSIPRPAIARAITPVAPLNRGSDITINDNHTNQDDNSSGGMHVLVVEDNAINQRVMAKQLEMLGCTVHLAGNGADALEVLQKTTAYRSRNRSTQPAVALESLIPLSIILMDVEMPVMDGLTCTRKIRDLEDDGYLIHHIPIIAITANARHEQVERAKQSGVNDVVTKPFRIPDLLAVMKVLTEER